MVKNKNKLKNHKKIIFGVMLAVVLGVSMCCAYLKVRYYNRVADSVAVDSARELVFLASDNLKSTAPIDAKTGNIYFPQAGLYLPATKDSLEQNLVYVYSSDDPVANLSISNRVMINALKSKSYAASNPKEFFDTIPHFQACSRGVTVSYRQLKDDETSGTLNGHVHLSNGKTAYLYSEANCPELSDTVSLLKNLRSY